MRPTHPALLLPDIINEIFPHLRVQTDAEASDGGKWVALVSAARVCKAFYGPAIKALWWGVPGIEPVLRMLARFSLLSVTHHRDISPDMVINRSYARSSGVTEVSAEDWDSLRRHTAYSRVIFQGSRHYCASADVYVYLSYKSNARPLFPNVYDLRWYAAAPDHLGLVPLLNPDLRRLKIAVGHDISTRAAAEWWVVLRHQDSPEAPSLDQLLQTTLPRLKGLVDLEVQASTSIPYMREWISWVCIGRLEHLRTLILDHSCVIRQTHFIESLASLPCLAELSLRLSREDSGSSLAFSGFLALEKLALDTVGEPNLVILNIFISPRLHTLCMQFECARQDTITTILNHAAVAYPCMRSITVKDRSGQSFEDGSHVPTFEAAFERIAENAAIEELVLQTYRPFYVCLGGDEELVRLAKSWPKLRTFSFLTGLFGGRITHHSILAFARECPDLRTLHLRGVCFNELTKEEVKALPVSAHGLTELGLCRARGGRAQRCGRFLRKLFPNMQVSTTIIWMCPSCPLDARYGPCTRALVNAFRLHQVPNKKRVLQERAPLAIESGHHHTGGFVIAP
ncbi:hypothetical protein BC628DRAFT_133715 [Trametes gibbosa]|nr:hypothetical protein BC628DRAFT_133715 [Trametes gibbosa]